MARKLTTEEFIEKARKVHGVRYGYEKVVYVNNAVKVEIQCKVHGSFWQQPKNHLQGQVCRRCQDTIRADRFRGDKGGFISRAKDVHGDRYDYANVVYVNARTKVAIKCPVHGTFHQEPHSHISGKGCWKCGSLKSAKTQTRTTEEFIEEASKIHGEMYDYSLVDYKAKDRKVLILCPMHGRFSMSANNHLRGAKCPQCSRLKSGFNNKAGFYSTAEQSNIYILKINDQFIKVGLAKEVHRRVSRINKESGYSVEKLYSVSGPAYKLWLLEQTILRLSNLEQHIPEVSFAGQSECLEMKELDKVMEIVQEWEKWNKEDK